MEWLYSNVQMWHLVTVVAFWVGWKMGDWIKARVWPKDVHCEKPQTTSSHVHKQYVLDEQHRNLFSHFLELENEVYQLKNRSFKQQLFRWLGCE
jgi:hypothetical protein